MNGNKTKCRRSQRTSAKAGKDLSTKEINKFGKEGKELVPLWARQ